MTSVDLTRTKQDKTKTKKLNKQNNNTVIGNWTKNKTKQTTTKQTNEQKYLKCQLLGNLLTTWCCLLSLSLPRVMWFRSFKGIFCLHVLTCPWLVHSAALKAHVSEDGDLSAGTDCSCAYNQGTDMLQAACTSHLLIWIWVPPFCCPRVGPRVDQSHHSNPFSTYGLLLRVIPNWPFSCHKNGTLSLCKPESPKHNMEINMNKSFLPCHLF